MLNAETFILLQAQASSATSLLSQQYRFYPEVQSNIQSWQAFFQEHIYYLENIFHEYNRLNTRIEEYEEEQNNSIQQVCSLDSRESEIEWESLRRSIDEYVHSDETPQLSSTHTAKELSLIEFKEEEKRCLLLLREDAEKKFNKIQNLICNSLSQIQFFIQQQRGLMRSHSSQAAFFPPNKVYENILCQLINFFPETDIKHLKNFIGEAENYIMIDLRIKDLTERRLYLDKFLSAFNCYIPITFLKDKHSPDKIVENYNIRKALMSTLKNFLQHTNSRNQSVSLITELDDKLYDFFHKLKVRLDSMESQSSTKKLLSRLKYVIEYGENSLANSHSFQASMHSKH